MNAKIEDIDWLTLLLYFVLVLTGIGLVYSVGYNDDNLKPFWSFRYEHGRQMMYFMVALVVGLAASLVESKFYSSFAYFIYAFTIVLLILVFLLAEDINGAKSWFQIGSVGIQPSEFAKVGVTLALATYLNTNKINLKRWSDLIPALGIVLLPCALVVLQGDAGTAIVFLSLFATLYIAGLAGELFVIGGLLATIGVMAIIYDPIVLCSVVALMGCYTLSFFAKDKLWFFLLATLFLILTIVASQFGFDLYMLFVNGIALVTYAIIHFGRKFKYLGALVLLSVITGIVLIFSIDLVFNNVFESHQQERVLVWLTPEVCDPYGARYNIDQSKLAIGSGSFFGRGYLEGNLTRGNFIPEQTTDFIFCSLGEQFGFVGSFSLIAVYTALILRIIFLGTRQRYLFSKFYAYSVASVFFIHLFINVGMTMNVLPTIGIPLPFISSGGSSLIAFTTMLAILLRLDMDRLELR